VELAQSALQNTPHPANPLYACRTHTIRTATNYRHAGVLAATGQAVIVNDNIGDTEKTSKELLSSLKELMTDKQKRLFRTKTTNPLTKKDAVLQITETIIQTT